VDHIYKMSYMYIW